MKVPNSPVVVDSESEAILPAHNDQYGKLLGRYAIDDGRNTYQVAVIYDESGQLMLDARSIWYRYGSPRYGKGFRIPITGGMAGELLERSAELIQAVHDSLAELESINEQAEEA